MEERWSTRPWKGVANRLSTVKPMRMAKQRGDVAGGLGKSGYVVGSVPVARLVGPIGYDDARELGQEVGGPQILGAAVSSPALSTGGADPAEPSSGGVMVSTDASGERDVDRLVSGEPGLGHGEALFNVGGAGLISRSHVGVRESNPALWWVSRRSAARSLAARDRGGRPVCGCGGRAVARSRCRRYVPWRRR